MDLLVKKKKNKEKKETLKLNKYKVVEKKKTLKLKKYI